MSELGLLEGRNVLLGFRKGETQEAVRDWLDWHRRFLGADGALIVATARHHGETDLDAVLAPILESMEIVVVEEEHTPPQTTEKLLESLRRQYMSRARAVACLDISDLMMQDRAGSPFDRAAGLTGEVLPLKGQRMFPMRLRRGKPAPHGDHSAIVQGEDVALSAWCVAPGQCPPRSVWHPDGIIGMPEGNTAPGHFGRAMGVAHPGVTIGKLVRKSDLAESPALVEMMTGAFGRRPPVAKPGKRALERAASERRAVTVVTTMKNEGPFILDWIAHHRSVGVNRFLVYTNDCLDGTDRLLELLSEAGVLRRDNPYRHLSGGRQHAAFRAAEQEPVVRHSNWLMTLDVDEYLNIRAGEGRVSDLLATVPEAGAVSMAWRLFGNADVHEFDDRPVTGQFHLAAPEYAPRPWQAWAFKTLYRNDGSFGGLGVHRPKSLRPERAGALCWLDGTGRPLPRQLWRNGWRMTTECWGYDLAGINHYAVRSAESFLVKRERGRVNHVGQDQGTNYWFRMNQNVTQDRSIRRLDDRVAAERARLAALPGVAEAHQAAVAWHRSRIAALKDDPVQRAFYAEITGPRLEKLSRLVPNFGSGVFYNGPEVIPDEMVARDPSEQFYFNV